MDLPLTITSIMRYGTSVFGDGEVVTWTGDGTRRRTYAEAGRRAARLANALRGLGVDSDQRVGTFMWNNAEHLEAYLAIPSMGAVLHTLNIRLAAADVGYIATHAEDQVVIVDASLVPKFAEILPSAPTVKHVIVTGGPLDETPGTDQLTGVGVHRYEDLLAAETDAFDWPSIDEYSAAAMCYTSGTPATRRASSTATGPPTCTRWAPALVTPSPCPSGIACCPSCQCSTPTRGAWPTPACCPGPP